jgi:hypothetical protein
LRPKRSPNYLSAGLHEKNARVAKSVLAMAYVPVGAIR